NQPVNLTATTDANGKFTFFQVQPGTYQLGRGELTEVLFNPTLAGSLGGIPQGQTVTTITLDQGQVGLNYNFPVRGIAPQGISLRDFVTTSTGPHVTTQTPGTGTAFGDGLGQYASPVPAGSAALGGFVLNTATVNNPGGMATSGIAGTQVTLTG